MAFLADYDDIQDVWDDAAPPDHPTAFGKWRELTKPFPFTAFTLRMITLWPKQRNAPYGTHSKRKRLAIALAGNAHAVINGEAFALRSGDCIWMPPKTPAALVNTSELPFSALMLETTEADDELQAADIPDPLKIATIASPRIVAVSAIEPVTYNDLFVRPIGRALGVTGFDLDIVDLGEDGAPLPYHTRTGSDQIYCVISGNVSAYIEGETQPLHRYGAYFAPHGQKRALQAPPRGQTRVAVFTVRTGKGQDETLRFEREPAPAPLEDAPVPPPNKSRMIKAQTAMLSSSAIRAVLLVLAGSVLMALSAQFAFNLPWNPVPVSLQTLALALVAVALGSRLGALAMVAYLAEGAAGLPVFAPPSSPAGLFGPTAGYLWAFPIAAFAIGYLLEHGANRTFITRALAIFAGAAIVLAGGAGWLSHAIGLQKAIAVGLLPFLPGDLLKVAAAAALAPYARALVGRVRV